MAVSMYRGSTAVNSFTQFGSYESTCAVWFDEAQEDWQLTARMALRGTGPTIAHLLRTRLPQLRTLTI